MCNHYRMLRTASEVGRLFGAVMLSELSLTPEVYHGNLALVVRQQDGQRRAEEQLGAGGDELKCDQLRPDVCFSSLIFEGLG